MWPDSVTYLMRDTGAPPSTQACRREGHCTNEPHGSTFLWKSCGGLWGWLSGNQTDLISSCMDGFRNKTGKVQENISSALHIPNLHYITCTHLYFAEYPNSVTLSNWDTLRVWLWSTIWPKGKMIWQKTERSKCIKCEKLMNILAWSLKRSALRRSRTHLHHLLPVCVREKSPITLWMM